MRGNIATIVLTVLLLGSVAVWAPAAKAGQTSAATGEPKRTYVAINVIMYQTSW